MRQIEDRVLVFYNNEYIKYSSSIWETITSTTPTEADFLDGNTLIELSTIPRSAWGKLDGLVDFYYYTDDVAKVSADINTNINYSPLDEINQDFDVVTFTDNAAITSTQLNYVAIPKPKLILPLNDIEFLGDLKYLVSDSTSTGLGEVEYIVSFDQGTTWKSFRDSNWTTIGDINVLSDVKTMGMTKDEINAIIESDWLSEFNGYIRVAYYIEQTSSVDVAKINSLSVFENVRTETPTLSLLTIVYDEVDKQYSGLMFMNTSQEYYSTSFGEILKYLDFGTLIAGQSSLDVQVILTNTLTFNVNNIHLSSDHSIDGLTIELSKTNAPFVAEVELFYSQTLSFNDTIDFYVRLSVDASAVGGGSFDIKVDADPA